MKKLKIIFLFLFLLIPKFVVADTVNYKINHYYVNANILENGDVDVQELIVLKGTFNGYIRDITYGNSILKNDGYANNSIYNASDIVIQDISAKKVNDVSFDTLNDSDFTLLTENKASNGGYKKSNLTYGYSYKMYFKSNYDTVAFRLRYTIKDAVVLHQDVAELYWTFIGDGFDDPMRDVLIKINLPEVDTSSDFRIWAHGDLSGNIEKQENKQIVATVDKLDAHSSVDVRTTFNKNLVDETIVKKVKKADALEEIVKVETERAEKANRQRKKMFIIYWASAIVSGIYTIVLIIAWIHVYRKYDKEYKSSFTNEYNREFIDDYNVEVVDYLMNKSITPNALSASILNLIYKKVIKAEEIVSDKKKKEYKFTLMDGEKENLNETEKCLIDFLFTKVGSNNEFTSKDLHNYAKGRNTCEKFLSNYTTWKNKVIIDAKEQNFFKNKGAAIGISAIFLFVAIILNVLLALLNVVIPFAIVPLLLSVAFLIYTFVFTKRSKKGADHYARWKAFKKFLNDFGNFDIKELPEIVLWERYMVYATLFGLADKVAKCMNVKIKELEESGIYVGDYYPTFNDYYFFNSINSDVHHAVSANTSAITSARANSASSSGFGGGGGFSSGGGFGGGGGGGRGF